jgi:hypothetical protein
VTTNGATPAPEEPVKLLWTSGWDSTFRLLDLVLVRHRAVQPYYFVLERASAAIERHTMERIKARLFSRWPQARGLVMETVVVRMDDVPPDRDAWAALSRLRAMGGARRVGGQYYELAAAAKHLDLADLEVGIHFEPGASWLAQLAANVEERDGVCRLAPHPEPRELEVFRRFAFPLLTLSKKDMAARAETGGFAELLEMTWFCHTPDRRGRPCGLCAPCRLTMSEGLGRRIPAVNRIKHRLLWPAIRVLTRLGARRRGRAVWNRLHRLGGRGSK